MEKYWGNKRFNSLVRQPSEEVVILENFSNREYYIDLLRVGEIAGASFETEDSNRNTSPPGKSGPGCQCSLTVALF